MTEELRLRYAKALEEVALAYERKRDRIQYESSDLTYHHKFLGGPFRRTDRVSPEQAQKDAPMFSVCSSFMHTILWEACRYQLCGSDIHHSCQDIVDTYPEQTVYAYAEGGEVKPKRGFRECLEALQEGDFIIIRNPKAGTMHVMLRISGERIIHCTGGKYKFADGREVWETFGAIRIDTIQNFFLDMLGVYPFHNFSHWWVIRILDAIDPEQYPLTEATKTRLENPGLNIDFTSSVRRYHTVREGDSITYTLRIRNDHDRNSTCVLENLPVEITLPQGTELQDTALDSLYTLQDGKLCRSVTVHPMQEQTLSVTVRVGALPKGTELKAEASVAGIPIAATPHTVGSRLPMEEAAKLTEAEGGSAEEVYAKILGKTVAIPTAEEMLDAMYERVPAVIWEDENREEFAHCRLLKKVGSHPAEAMLVPGLWGGRSLGEVSQYDRVLELRPEYLLPGDVILAVKNLRQDSMEAEEMLILGGGKVLKNGEKTDSPDFDSLLACDWFAVLRPYLGGN